MTQARDIIADCLEPWSGQFDAGIYHYADRLIQHLDRAGFEVVASVELPKLEDEIQEYVDLCDRLSFLLTATANALKGDPSGIVRHDWADLPAVAAELVRENVQLEVDLSLLRSHAHDLEDLLGLERDRP